MPDPKPDSATCAVHRLGLVPYQQAWKLQERLAAQIAIGERMQSLLLLEHAHIFTFGRRSKPAERSTCARIQAENLLWGADELDQRGIQTLWVDRGGDVTYHGPGQLVGYPLLCLAPGGLCAGTNVTPNSSPSHGLIKADYVGYLRKLEQTIIRTLKRFEIHAIQLEGKTGVWIESGADALRPSKIAAIGVKVDAQGISRHGFALNVDPDMRYWQGIIACGLAGYPAVSLAELLQPTPPMKDVEEAVIEAFQEVFGLTMIVVDQPAGGLDLADLAVGGNEQ